MDVKIQAAIVGAVTAILVTAINWLIQRNIQDREQKKKKKIAEGTVALYLCQLRLLYENFSTEEETSKSLMLGISINEHNLEEVEKIINIIEEYDSYLTVQLFYIRQSLSNIRKYAKMYHNINSEDTFTKKHREIIGYINIDAKRGLKDVDISIEHACRYAEDETIKFLLLKKEFNTFLEAVLGTNQYKKLKTKLKI